MNATSVLSFCALITLVGACSGDAQFTDAGDGGHDASNAMDALMGRDVQSGTDNPNVPVDVPNTMDGSNGSDVSTRSDVVTRRDAQNIQDVQDVQDVQDGADTGLACVAQNADCNERLNNCCAGNACMFMKIATHRCRPVAACAARDEPCNQGVVYCCPFSFCANVGPGNTFRCVAP